MGRVELIGGLVGRDGRPSLLKKKMQDWKKEFLEKSEKILFVSMGDSRKSEVIC